MNPNFPGRNMFPTADPFGLIAWLEETRIVLPLKAVDVAFEVGGDLAEVYLDQVFHQTAARPLDVVYTFPLPAEAAVFKCELIVNDRVIQARVEERERAQEIARTMKAAGHRTSLVEMERNNLFTLSLGNVQPDDLIVIRFAWFQLLDHLQDTKSLSIPFSPGVRYIPGQPLLRSNRGKGVVNDSDQVPDASRISPPRIDELHPDAALVSLRGTLDARFVKKDSVSSATHPLFLRGEGERLEVTLPKEGQVPDRDFVLRWTETKAETLELRSISCLDGNDQYAVIRLDAPEDAPVATDRSCDYYFLVDRSGSMGGRKWTCTTQALRAFVRELGVSDRVWITLFESDHRDFAEAPLPAAELGKDPAFHALEKLGVGGGTNLAPALEHVFKQIATHSTGRDPVIILITDGQVGNEAQIEELLRVHREVAIHAFGIDTAVNDAFLKQMAAQHRGACVLMTPNDDIQGAVAKLGIRLRRPVLTNLNISADWQIASGRLPDIHSGEHVVIALKGPTHATHLELIGHVADQKAHTFRFDLKPEPLAAPRLLWARQTMDRLLAERKKTEAIALAIRHNVICKGAAFIAYDLKEKVTLSTQEIYQPAMEVHAVPMAPAAPVACSAAMGSPRLRKLSEASPRNFSFRSAVAFLKPRREPDSKRLLEKWKKEASRLPIFQGHGGEMLVNVLLSWVQADVEDRLKWLEPLLKDLRGKEPRAFLKKFIETHIKDSGTADSLRMILEQVSPGIS